ncbi:MAG: 50S ribosomal protein L11 methyltransferase [Myxococcaceae bacterium]
MKTTFAKIPDALEASLKRQRPFLCPELELWLMDPESPLHRATNPDPLGMPYWAFAWPGGQVLARYVLDHPEVVRGRRVLDFASGCAIEGLAALKAGASSVLCADIDPLAATAARRNAELLGLPLETTTDDLIGTTIDADVILAGDACYEPALAARVRQWLARQRAVVLIGDPLRVPGIDDGLERVATYDASFDGDPRGLTTWKTHVLRAVPFADPAR